MDRANYDLEPVTSIPKRRILAAAVAATALVFSMIKLGDALPFPQPEQQIELGDFTGAELGNAADKFYLGINNDYPGSIGARELSWSEANIS